MSAAAINGPQQHPVPTVLATVAAGYHRYRDIAGWTRRPEPAVRTELAAEVTAGRLTRTAFGKYGLTAAGQQHVMALLSAARHVPLDPATTDTAELWRHRVARSILPGSQLTDPQHRDGVEEYHLQLNPAAHTLDDVLRFRNRIAAALERPAEQVIVEGHRTRVNSQARLILVGDDSPLYQHIEHPGAAAFDSTSGQITIGAYADGEPVRWTLWNQLGTVNSAVIGGQESGTTTVLHGVLTAVAGSDLVQARVVDLAGVGGLAGFGQPTAVTHDDAHELLESVLREIVQRLTAGEGVHPPRPDRPLQLVVLADALTVLGDGRPALRGRGDRLEGLVEAIQRLGRKATTAVVTEAKALTLNQFANSVAMRDGLTGGNLAVLRSQGQSAGPARRTAMDPAELPMHWQAGHTTAGVGYTVRRSAAFRAFHVPITC